MNSICGIDITYIRVSEIMRCFDTEELVPVTNVVLTEDEIKRIKKLLT